MSETEDPQKPADELHNLPTNTEVVLHYFSAGSANTKTKAGTKTSHGLQTEAAAVDTGTEFPCGTPRILRVTRGGAVKVEGPKETQRLGVLTDVERGDAA
jgi:hypothetical protein